MKIPAFCWTKSTSPRLGWMRPYEYWGQPATKPSVDVAMSIFQAHMSWAYCENDKNKVRHPTNWKQTNGFGKMELINQARISMLQLSGCCEWQTQTRRPASWRVLHSTVSPCSSGKISGTHPCQICGCTLADLLITETRQTWHRTLRRLPFTS